MSATTKLGFIRLVLAWAFCWTSWSFKLFESPAAPEDAVAERLHEEVQEIRSIENPASAQGAEGAQGAGELAKNLEFLLIKVAQLEALAEMQQAKLEEQTKKILSQEERIQSLEKGAGGAGAFVETEHKDAQTRLKEATDVLKRVMLKHGRQRQNGMLHHRHRGRLEDASSTVDTLELALPVIGGGGGLGGLGADCGGTSFPSITSFDEEGLKINFGRLKCHLTVAGQGINLFEFEFGEKAIPLPGPLKDLFNNIVKLLPEELKTIVRGDIMALMPHPIRLIRTLGDSLMDCTGAHSDLVRCLGFKIVSNVAPLSYLTQLGDIFKEFIESFAKLASKLVAQAMKGGESLLQTAVTTEFPAAGAQAMVHHRSANLVIKKHSQKMPGKHAELLQEMANLEEKPKPPAAVKWSFDDYGPETHALVTQLLVSNYQWIGNFHSC